MHRGWSHSCIVTLGDIEALSHPEPFAVTFDIEVSYDPGYPDTREEPGEPGGIDFEIITLHSPYPLTDPEREALEQRLHSFNPDEIPEILQLFEAHNDEEDYRKDI